MCNAWNHSSNCRCGWGGDGHSGRRFDYPVARAFHAQSSFATFKGVESYTRPNSKCPVCSASVFFYQSPNGGRVYFDELGGDWPKHPCTSDRFSCKSQPIAHSRLTAVPNLTEAIQPATPLVVSRVENHPFSGYARLFAEMDGRTLVLWTSRLDLQEGAPFFCVQRNNDTLELESIAFADKNRPSIFAFRAYLRQMDFEASRSQVRSADRTRGLRRVTAFKKKSSRPVKVTKRQLNAIDRKSRSVPTAMSLAFDRAMRTK